MPQRCAKQSTTERRPGAPTICGVGPVGGKAHTEEEYIEIATLAQRARVAALTILRHGAIAKAASIDAAPRQTRRPQSTQPCLKTGFCAAWRGQQQARLAAGDTGH